MRLLNIMLAKVKGGVETMALRYHEALEVAGFEVISVGHPQGELARHVPPNAFQPLIAAFDSDPLAVLRLRIMVRAVKPDLILVHGNRASSLALSVLSGLAPRTVQVMHNQFFKARGTRARASICASASVLEAVKDRYPDVPAFEVSNFTHLEHRPVKPAPTTVPVLGAIGRLHEQKAFDVLLKALGRLHAEGVVFDARIAGEGPERAQLEAQSKRLGLDGVLSLTGWVSPVWDFMNSLDLFIMPSRYEPFGLVVIEAMAAGAPIVSTDVDGPLEILEAGKLAWMFRNENDASLAEAIKAAIGDWPKTLEMGRAAQAKAMQVYDFAPGAARLKSAIEAISAL